MPKYRVKAPDGKTYEVTAPDGASQEEVLAFAQKHYGGGAGSDTPAPVESQQSIAPTESVAGLSVPQQFGADVRSFAKGAASIPDIVLGPASRAAEALSLPIPHQYTASELVDKGADAIGLPRNPETVRTAAIEGSGSVLPTLGIGGILKQAPGLVGRAGEFLATRPGLQTVSAATGAGSSEVARESGAGPGGQLAAGLVGGLAPGVASLPGSGARAGRAFLEELSKEAKARGMDLRPTAIESGMIDRFRGLPLTGAKNRYEQDVTKFNKWLAKTLGAPEGTPVEKVIPRAKKVASKDYNDLTQKYDFDLNDDVLTRIAAYRNTKPELGGAEPATVQAIDKFLNEAAQLGGRDMPGELFKRLDTQLNKIPYKSESNQAKKQFQNYLREQFKANMKPEDAALWDDVNRRWGDIQDVQKLYAKASGDEIDPKKLLNAITSSRAGKQRKAMGNRGELGTLADIGQKIRPPSYLHPGTLLPVGTLAAGSSLMIPSTGVPLAGLALLSNLAGRVVDSPRLMKLFTGAAKQSTRGEKAAASALGAGLGTQSQRDKNRNSGGGR